MKKLLSAILTICLVLSCAAPALAASFPDLEARHAWAVPAIDYMMSKGIVNGYEDDTFRPDRTVTRVEFIKMLNMTFGLTATAAIPYTDVPADQWYAPYVKQAVAQGYLLNYGSLLNPNGALSRQEAAALLVRYLNPDESLKASTTTFTDYSTIKTAYRDYVLLAAGIGLINGYEDDTFKPDKTLNRAEALAILYRAAGMICNDNVVESEAGAGDKNAVIIKNNITVTGANLPGRVIITEGVSGGTVTLSECQIGELIIRGTAKVNLSGCSVDSVIVDCSSKGKSLSVSIQSGTVVKNMTLRTPVEISTESRTTLTKLTVEENATRSSFSGSGTFSNAVINASGFVSDKIPTSYTLGKGISATFADKVYNSGSTPSASDTGFTTQPSVYTSSSYNYLTMTPAATGTVQYYYTNTASVPTAELFDNYYNVAAARSSFSVTANRSVDTQVGATSLVSTYTHLVVRITDNLGNKYQPVVLSNRASDGFSVAPTVTAVGNYQYLAFTPSINGTVYYYYTNSSTVPTIASFNQNYESYATRYSGDVDVTAGQAVNKATEPVSSVSSYGYVAVMMMDSNYKEYQPILITVGGSSTSNTGFAVEPYSTFANSAVTLGFTPVYGGTVEYYFSASANAPTISQFETNNTLTPITLRGTIPVSAGASFESRLLNAVSTTSYPYIVVRLKSNSGMAYTPVVVRINSSSSTTPGAAGSGFTMSPVVSYASGKYTLSFQAMGSGTLYYYLTNNPDSPGSMFMGNYDMTTSNQLAVKLGGTITTTGTQQTMPTILSTGLGDDYKYMVVMLRLGGTAYTPMVISLPDVQNVVIQDTGFIVGPCHNTYQTGDNLFLHQIELCTATAGTVWYYYTEDPTVPDPADVVDTVMHGSEGVAECGYETVVGYQKKQIALSFNYTPASYLVLMFTDANNNYYQPIVMLANGMAASSNISSGFAKNPTVSSSGGVATLDYITMESGKLYYFFTNNASDMGDMWNFFSNSTTRGYYSAAAEGLKGVIDLSVGKGSVRLTTTKSTLGYTHVAIIFQRAAGGTGGYCAPLVLSLSGSSGSSGSASASGFNDTPYIMGNNVYFVPSAVGTVYYGYTQTNSTVDLYGALGALGSWGGLGGLGGLGGIGGASNGDTISTSIATLNYGSSVSVAYPGMAQSIYIPASYFTQFKYIALWTVNAAGNMTTPVFVSLGNTSGGSTLSSNGFTIQPQYIALMNQVSFTSAVNGQVYYFYTNSNVNYNTQSAFTTAFYQAMEAAGGIASFQSVIAGQASAITVPRNSITNDLSYKYVWLYVVSVEGNYTPVRHQLY